MRRKEGSVGEQEGGGEEGSNGLLKIVIQFHVVKASHPSGLHANVPNERPQCTLLFSPSLPLSLSLSRNSHFHFTQPLFLLFRLSAAIPKSHIPPIVLN